MLAVSNVVHSAVEAEDLANGVPSIVSYTVTTNSPGYHRLVLKQMYVDYPQLYVLLTSGGCVSMIDRRMKAIQVWRRMSISK